MASLLFACELGEGLGHLNRLIAVAHHFAAHDLTFAVQGSLQEMAIRASLARGVRIVTSPILRPNPNAGRPEIEAPDQTLADILRRTGLDDRTAVSASVGAWTALLDKVRPSAVVSDYAPTLRVAVAGRIPHVVLGNGFTIPPRMSPLPVFEDASSPGEGSRAAEAAVLSCFNAVRADHGLLPLGCLADALQGDATFVASYPFFDPYQALRETTPLQPFNLPLIAAGPSIPERAGPDIFAYLDGAYSGINLVLDTLNRMDRRVELFIRHAEHADVVRNCAPHVSAYSAPADFARVLPQARLLVHHGGPATGVGGLLAGVPQLLMPRHTEQLLNARGLATLGTSVGIGFRAHADAEGLQRLMLRLLDSPNLGQRAGAVARELQATRIADAERPVVDAVEAAMSSGITRRAGAPSPGGGSAAVPRPPRSPETRKAAVMASDRDRPSGRPMRTYLICSSPRVGSNLVCDALAAFEGGGQPVEYFNPRSIEAYLRRIGAESLPRARYLDYLFSRRRDGAGVLGIKVHHHQLVKIFPAADDQRAFLTRFDAVLFLRRRNKVRQAISEARARASSVWYAEEAQHVELARMASARYQGTAIAGCLASVMADDSGWEMLLAAARIPHAVMFYEDMVQDLSDALRGISLHLGLGLKVDGCFVPSTHRLGDGLNEIWEGRFRQEIFGEGAMKTKRGSPD